LADDEVSQEPEAQMRRGLIELSADRFDLRVVGRHTGAHQPPRYGKHLEHVDVDDDRLGGVAQFQQ
jgi:hypothetical protein